MERLRGEVDWKKRKGERESERDMSCPISLSLQLSTRKTFENPLCRNTARAVQNAVYTAI